MSLRSFPINHLFKGTGEPPPHLTPAPVLSPARSRSSHPPRRPRRTSSLTPATRRSGPSRFRARGTASSGLCSSTRGPPPPRPATLPRSSKRPLRRGSRASLPRSKAWRRFTTRHSQGLGPHAKARDRHGRRDLVEGAQASWSYIRRLETQLRDPALEI